MLIPEYELRLDESRLPKLVQSAQYEFGDRSMTHPYEVTNFVYSLYNMHELAEEEVVMIGVDSQLTPIGIFKVSHGTSSMSVVSHRSIFTRLLLCGATGLFLIHNHPTRNTKPSKEDIQVTEDLLEASKLMGFRLYDHLIVGGTYFSFAEEHYI